MDGPSNTKIDYLKATQVAFAMNEAFGPLGWDVIVDELGIVREYQCNRAGVVEEGGAYWNVIAMAKVTVLVWTIAPDGSIKKTIRADVSSGTPYGDKSNTFLAAYDGAIKAAVSNAVKRACRFFGPQTGLLLALTSADERESMQALIDADAHAKELEVEAQPLSLESAPTETLAEAPVEEPQTEGVVETSVSEVPVEAEAAVEMAAESVSEPVSVDLSSHVDPATEFEATTDDLAIELPAPSIEEIAGEPKTLADDYDHAPVESGSTPVSADYAATVEDLQQAFDATVGVGISPTPTIEPPGVLLELPGAAAAVRNVCYLAEPTDAINAGDGSLIHKGLVAAFGDAEAMALWTFVGADLTTRPLLISRDQVLVIAQALEEASASEGGIAEFLAGLLSPPAEEEIVPPPADEPVASDETPVEEASTDGTSSTTAEADAIDWISKLKKHSQPAQNEQIIKELTTLPLDAKISAVTSSSLHGIAIHNLKARNMPTGQVNTMWQDVGVTFGKGKPTIKQAQQFAALLPSD
jgi:recombination DNA repair RAD52 pathway protein